METSEKALTHFLKKGICILLSALALILCLFFAVTGSPDRFQDTYVGALPLKYETLQRTEGKKIIIIGGSSAAFGIDEALLKAETGYEVVNLGLHAGFGPLFNTEIAKSGIQAGDIVLLGYEYELSQDAFQKLGDVNLIMEGIDSHLAIYRSIPLRNFPEILGNLLHYAMDKLEGPSDTVGTYARDSFDAAGSMILPRKTGLSDYEDNKDHYGIITEEKLGLTEGNRDYLRNFKAFTEEKGASVYLIAPPLLKEACTPDAAALRQYALDLEKETGIPYLSDPAAYLFPGDWMFDTIYHCNDLGERERTRLLSAELKNLLNP